MLDDIDDEWWVIALLSIFALWLFLTALRVLVATIPACMADLRRAVAALMALVTRQPLPPEPEQLPAARQEPRWWHPQALLGVLISGTKWTGIVLAFAAFARPTIDYIGEAMEEAAEDRSRTETRDVSVAREPDPDLLQATLEVLAPWGNLSQEPHSFGATVKAGWTTDPANPDERKRVTVRLGDRRDEHSVDVYVDIQRKSRGLWTESRDQWRNEREAREELKAQLKQRAAELSQED